MPANDNSIANGTYNNGFMNITQSLIAQLLANGTDDARLTTDDMLAATNLDRTVVDGTVPTNSNSIANGTYYTGLSVATTTGSGTGAKVQTLTIDSGAVTGLTFSDGGSGYAAADTITVSYSSGSTTTALDAYTIVADDLTSGVIKTSNFYWKFAASDTLLFKITARPHGTALGITDNEPRSQDYAVKVTMV
jgi:hypothetical protein